MRRATDDKAYGETNGQIGTAKSGNLEAVLTSPPWENNSEGHIGAHKWGDVEKAEATSQKGNGCSPEARAAQFERDKDKTYGDSAGQIGRLKSGEDEVGRVTSNQSKETSPLITEHSAALAPKESYWQAMRQVFAARYRSLKPGGVAVIVVKDYCRDGKRVRLCDDTLRLLCFLGFEPVERIHAMLVSETTHDDLFAGEVRQTKQRKSFFRRIYEAKLPEGDERRIDYEEALIVRKPGKAKTTNRRQ